MTGPNSGSDRIRDESGSLVAFVAVLAVALFALTGLVVDGGRALALHRSVNDVAEQASRAGAAQLSVDALRSGLVTVDPEMAVAAAEAFLAAAGQHGTVVVTGNIVTVEVSAREPTTILGMIGLSQISVSASATATDVHGVSSQDG